LFMLEFFAALVVFVLMHAVPARPGLRGRLVDRLGRRNYLILYSVVSLALLAWLISAAINAPQIVIWDQAPWQAALALIAVPLALALIFAGLIMPNPLSVSFRAEGHEPARPGLLAVTRHPVLWGFGLWGGAHIAAIGDLVSIILFGALSFFALLGTSGWLPIPATRRSLRFFKAARGSPSIGRCLPVSPSRRLFRRLCSPVAICGCSAPIR
jgi:uncharacterized membrane protein